jgi:hypothetical protein
MHDFDGNTSALAFICTHGSFATDWPATQDWQLVDRGGAGDTEWRLFAQYGITKTGPPEPIRFAYRPGGNGYMSGFTAFHYGGDGRWQVTKGEPTTTGTSIGYVDPPSSPAWMQLGMVGHPWTGVQVPPGIGFATFQGTVGAYCYPPPGDYDVDQWAAAMARAPYTVAADGPLTFNCNGLPGEQALALSWGSV